MTSHCFVVLDLETTGLDPARDEIIEIGAVKYDGVREVDTLSSLIHPGRAIPLSITELTGISDRDVATAPRFSAVRQALVRFVGDAIVVGHNVRFDLGFLHRRDCLRRQPYIDTLELATILMPNEPRFGLSKLAERLGIEVTTQHRALDDARTTLRLFTMLQGIASDLPGETLYRIGLVSNIQKWPLQIVFADAQRSRGGEQAEQQLQRSEGTFKRVVVENPLTPVDRRTSLDVAQLGGMLEPGGTLEQAFPDFEYRPQQVEMMEAVADAFNHSRHLIVEAGTGTGKSIAYLLPAIHWAVANGERVVISTNTINLQDQLYGKDIPDLERALSVDVRTSILKGRSNYLCPRRLEALQNKSDLQLDELRVLTKVLVWLPNTKTGDRSELSMYSSQEWAVWSHISSDADTCTADRCWYRRQGQCFYQRARLEAEGAHIVVVNHALLLSDVAAENRVLPQYNYLVVDEAHHLEDATTQQLGYNVGRWSVESILAQIGLGDESFGGFTQQVLMYCRGQVPEEIWVELQECAGVVHRSNERSLDGLRDLFDDLTLFVAEYRDSVSNSQPYDYRVRLTRELRIQPEWERVELVWDDLAERLRVSSAAFEYLLEVLAGLEGNKLPGYDDLVQDGTALQRQLAKVAERLDSVLLDPRSDEITWVQTRAKTNELYLCAVPLRVSHLVEQHLLWPKEAAIFTSATLRTGGDFGFIKERLGARDAEELAVGSPFDYRSQVMLYLPTDMPEPHEPYAQQRFCEGLVALAKATQGRMLVLFTSYSQLRATYSTVQQPLRNYDITVSAQGQGASRSQLLDNFRSTPRTVLLGTRSFWEGVDVPGEALSCVVIAKIPFAVPSDPVFAARSAEMDDPFYEYAVPDAILRFRQGFGRLIRTRTDRGLVVVMDKRVLSKKYGELFIESLPKCTTIRGALTDLPDHAALWLTEGYVGGAESDLVEHPSDQELEYVSFDDL